MSQVENDATNNNIVKEYIVFDIKDIIFGIKDICLDLLEDKTKNTNIYSCESKIVFETHKYIIIHKHILEDENENENEKSMDLFLTYKISYGHKHFLRGYLYRGKKEHKINHYCVYESLKLYNKRYNNIAVCSLDERLL